MMCFTEPQTDDSNDLRVALEIAKRAARDVHKEAVWIDNKEAAKAARAAYGSLIKAIDALDKKELD